MFIQTESTDNPDQMKFLPGQPVLGQGALNFPDRASAFRAPLALRIFEVEGVGAVTLGPDWITVTRQGAEWQHIKPAILGAIMEHFVAGGPAVTAPPREEGDADTEIIVARIKEALLKVIDPELGYNILDLGLIYDVAVKGDGATHILMTTTTVGCPATDYLMAGARGAAGGIEGVTDIDVELTYEPHWDPDMMSPKAKAHFRIDG